MRQRERGGGGEKEGVGLCYMAICYQNVYIRDVCVYFVSKYIPMFAIQIFMYNIIIII